MRQGYICDRVRNRKNHFETFLTLKEEPQEWEIQMKTKTKHMSFAGKCNISLNFPTLNIPCSIGRKAVISKLFFWLHIRTLSYTRIIFLGTLRNIC